jgi:hypothetical protein
VAQSNILPLPGARKVRRARPAPQAKPFLTPSRWVAMVGIAVIAALLFLSLSHLAGGIQLVTRCASWEAIALAAGIDVGLVVAESALLVASATALKIIRRWCTAMIGGTLVVSAALNALAFSNGAAGWWLYASIGFGVFVPVAVFVLTKIVTGLASK